MRISLSGTKARVERLATRCHANAAATDWDKYVAVLCSARTNPRPRVEMTPEAFATWSERLRASVRGTGEAKLAERIIAARQRLMHR